MVDFYSGQVVGFCSGVDSNGQLSWLFGAKRADRMRWGHIQRVYELCDRNVSETARRLNMHRRTLQRILAKRSPR